MDQGYARLCDLQFLQCLNTPDNENDDEYGENLGKVLCEKRSSTGGIDQIDQQRKRKQHQTLPYFLMFQIGEVVAQPPTILSQGVNKINKEQETEQQTIPLGI